MTRPSRVVAVLLAFAVAVSLAGAQARPTPNQAAAGASEQARTAIAAPGRPRPEERKFGIPYPRIAPPASDPYNLQTVYDAVQDGTSARVKASKVQLTLPPSIFLLYDRFCAKSQGFDENGNPFFYQACCPNLVNTRNCKPDAVVNAPRTSADRNKFDPNTNASVSWTRNDAPLWVSSPRGASRPYGIFAAFRVRTLAFGAVPVSALVHVSQPVAANGQVVPLRFLDLYLNPGYPRGTKVEGFGPRLTRDPGSRALFFQRDVKGPLDIRLSDVRVDGRGIDVGPSCRTATPAQLDYVGPRGTKDISVPAPDVPGRPGEFDPLSSDAPGQANGTISIPHFAGCRDGARSLDPLITALVSGRNPVTLRLRSGAYDCSPTNPVGGCPDYPGYDGPIARQPRPKALTTLLGRLPDASARRLVRGLPSSLARLAPSRYRR